MSPRLTLRADSEKHRHALTEGKNFIITPQGGATMRHGQKYVGDPAGTSDKFRTIRWGRGGDLSDILVELTDLKVRFWVNDALIESTSFVPIQLDTMFPDAALDDVQHTSYGRQIILTHPDYPPHYILQESANSLTLTTLPFSGIPEWQFFDFKSPAFIPDLSADYTIALTGFSNNDRFSFQYDGVINSELDGEGFPVPIEYRYSNNGATTLAELIQAFEDVPALSQASVSGVDNGSDNYTITVDGANAGKVAVITTTVGSGTADITITGDVNTGREPAWSYPYVVQNGSNYYQCTAAHIASSATEPGTGGSWQSVWSDLGTTAPEWWNYQHLGANPWVNGSIYSPWDRGFPGACRFHEQRLIFAGSQDAPSTLWGSRIGVYDDFTNGPNTADPFSFALDADGTPKVNWLESQNGLLCGTSEGEWLITADVTLSPGDINAEKQNHARSALAVPVSVNKETFYIELGKNKVRSTRWLRELSGFTSTDVSIIADQLFFNRVRRIAVMYTPEVLIACVTDDGRLLTLSYEPGQGVGAWMEMETDGVITDVTSIFSEQRGEDELYMCVSRGGTYRLERMPYPPRVFGANLQGQVYMDSYIEGVGGISNLGHLEGMTVGVTDNDAWVGEFVVSSGTIPYTPVAHWAVGLRYTGRLKTFEQSQDGVRFGTARRWNKLYTRILDSALPIVNGTRAPDRTPQTPMNLPEPLRTEDSKMVNLGFGDGSIEIEQDLPFPTHILGFYGQFGSNNA